MMIFYYDNIIFDCGPDSSFFQGDYEMVVNDYSKAKSLVSDNAPIVFKKGIMLLCICYPLLDFFSKFQVTRTFSSFVFQFWKKLRVKLRNFEINCGVVYLFYPYL